MPAVKDGGQAGFTDVPFMNDDLAEAIERYLEHKESASEYAKANKDIKEILPGVEEPTRFVIGERYFIEVTPQSVDGYAVKARRQQRKRIKESHEA